MVCMCLFGFCLQEKQNEARYLRDHKEELIEELATTIVQKVSIWLSSSESWNVVIRFFYDALPLVLKNIYILRPLPCLFLRSSRGGSDQICRQSTTLSGLNLSPWSSPVSCRLHLSLRPRHRTRRTPSRTHTPCGWVLGKHNSKPRGHKNNVWSTQKCSIRRYKCENGSQPEWSTPLLSRKSLNKDGLFVF